MACKKYEATISLVVNCKDLPRTRTLANNSIAPTTNKVVVRSSAIDIAKAMIIEWNKDHFGASPDDVVQVYAIYVVKQEGAFLASDIEYTGRIYGDVRNTKKFSHSITA